MLIASHLNIVAATTENNTSINTLEETIINQAMTLNESKEMNNRNFNIISLSDNNQFTLSANNSDKNQAIQCVYTNEDGLVEVVTTIPYKCLPSGELINSFNYASMQTRNTNNNVIELVDGTFTIITYYTAYQSSTSLIRFFRHVGLEAFWNSNNSSMSVSNMFVEYVTTGELHPYPECLSGGTVTLDANYSIRSIINQNNPVKSQSYLDGNNIMPADKAVKLTNFMEHEGGVNFSLTYSVNGRNYTKEGAYDVYNVF